MKNWKLVAGFGGAGAVLSLLLGVVAGNPFGVILLRLVVSAVVAGALGLGMSWLVGRFLPELGLPDGQAPARPGNDAAPEGGRVDIVLPAENPHASEETVAEGAAVIEDAEELGTVEAAPAMGTGAAAVEAADDTSPVATPDLALEDSVVEELEPEAGEEIGSTPATGGGASGAGAPAATARAGKGRGGLEGFGMGDQDPEQVARAVRTMLKRDQQG